jgi:hypothetical protein
MSGRDLLYKPPVPVVPTDEDEADGKKVKSTAKSKAAREAARTIEAQKETRNVGETGATAKQGPAYRAAYFNKDISGARELNQRESTMKALRGAEGASDLKKVTLPKAAHHIDTPDPKVLRGAGDLMGLDGLLELSLATLLGRQGAWTRGQGVTAEMIAARQKYLEKLVEQRRRALARIRGKRAGSVTLDAALAADGKDVDDADDVVEEGRKLVVRTSDQAAAMHRRIAKALGIKLAK